MKFPLNIQNIQQTSAFISRALIILRKISNIFYVSVFCYRISFTSSPTEPLCSIVTHNHKFTENQKKYLFPLLHSQNFFFISRGRDFPLKSHNFFADLGSNSANLFALDARMMNLRVENFFAARKNNLCTPAKNTKKVYEKKLR